MLYLCSWAIKCMHGSPFLHVILMILSTCHTIVCCFEYTSYNSRFWKDQWQHSIYILKFNATLGTAIHNFYYYRAQCSQYYSSPHSTCSNNHYKYYITQHCQKYKCMSAIHLASLAVVRVRCIACTSWCWSSISVYNNSSRYSHTSTWLSLISKFTKQFVQVLNSSDQ